MSQPDPASLAATVRYRYEVRPADRQVIHELIESTGFFNQAEVAIALELIDDRLAKGQASGYEFVLADWEGQTCGYTCYGPIAGTLQSYDLYWIAVHRDFQRRRLGSLLLSHTEERIRLAGGRRIYAETSGRAQYLPTRRFYQRHGYRREAELVDFYAPGDNKVIYVKTL